MKRVFHTCALTRRVAILNESHEAINQYADN